MTLIEGNMMVMAPKLETYRYTTMDTVSDESIDSDDERFNYVIDLDYKEDSNESIEKEPASPKHEVHETLDKDTNSTVINMKEPTYKYTLKEEPVLNQDVDYKHHTIGSKTKTLEKDHQNYQYTLDGSKLYIDNGTIKPVIVENRIQETVTIKDTKDNEPKSNHSNVNNSAINKSDSSKVCNITVSGFITTAKPVGASKRKRKLDNTITNLMKAKSVCVRDTTVQDIPLPRRSNSPPNVNTTSSLPSPVISDHSRSAGINQHSIDLSQKSISVPKPYIPSSVSQCYSSVISSLSLSPSSYSSSDGPNIPTTSIDTPQHHPSMSTASHVPNNESLDLLQKSFNRRKSSVVYRCDNVNEDNNSFNHNALNLSINKVKQEPVKQELSDQDEVMDLSKSSKLSTNQSTYSGHEGVMDLSKPSKAVTKMENTPIKSPATVKEEPVDLSNTNLPSMVRNQDVKKEPGIQNGQTDHLQVMDIFKDMMTQEKGGAVTMTQFMSWMQKMQPGFMENLNMMQLNAYYMQFNYWMQAFYNNTIMKGLANQKGIETHLQQQKKNGRQRKEKRLSVPVPLGQNNISSPDISDKSTEQSSLMPTENVTDDVISNSNDYNANRVKHNDIEFPSCPEMNILKGKYGCYIAERDGKIKFFVKDNEEIKSIVDIVMAVADLKENETHNLERDENGLCARFVCRICEQKFFHLEHLSKHVKTLHVQKRFQCDQCERSFHDAGNYRQHMRVHDASDIPYECPECNRRFRHKCTLKVHMRIHTGEKPFKCDVCQATFKISSGLQTHMRKHTGETPYACEFCSLRFKCQSNLKQHLFQHTQARPFPCDICGKSYSRKSIRDSHMLTHYKDTALSSDLNVTI